ncbi:GGDEF domain-containing protein [Thiorhodospira sibirica]|uniref:GGDEF domain-containing protein n=1 Tax=Thiorhodospira sibirica TaxID=154347 RepID=UPI00131F3F1B|nr:GGDEF domain-containing protein [Thiorhodospira sibirica]
MSSLKLLSRFRGPLYDELGRLAESFNSIFEQTRQAHQALEDYAHALEEKVKERTYHLEQANQQLHQLSQRDGLTGVYNRHYFDQQAPLYWQDFQEKRQPLSVLLTTYQFTHGHEKPAAAGRFADSASGSASHV